MELLFNKENNGNLEFKELLGFIDADLKYMNLESDTKSATKEIIKLIGKEVYLLTQAAYISNNNKDLVYAVRYPIAINAYRKYAPSNDLAHTNKGRVSRTEEHEKMAFEWMIEKDNKAIERKYYQALDELIDYLDEEISIWKNTESYKNTQKLFIRKTSDFDDYFPINNSRLLLIKLTPGIRKAENQEIKPRIGKELFDNMKNSLRGDTVTNFTVNNKLLEKIKESCAFYAMAWSMNRLSVQLFPEGVLQSVVSDKNTINAKLAAIKSETEAARQSFKADADACFKEIEEIIKQINPPAIAAEDDVLPIFNPNDNFIST